MKYLKYFLIIFILFLTPKVYALDYNVSSTITAMSGSGSTGGHYNGNYLNGQLGNFVVNTRYTGLLQKIQFNLPKPASIEGDCFMTNMTYKVTMNMATEDWRNRFGSVEVKEASSSPTNWSNGSVTFVSMKKIYFTFKIPSSYTTCAQFVNVTLNSSATFTPFTGDQNWNLSSIILSDELSNSSGGSSSGGGSGSTGATNQDIINNQNQNNNALINNQNQNTTNIIDNANQNTKDIIDSQNTSDINNINSQRREYSSRCTNVIDTQLKYGKTFSNTGSLVDDPNGYYTEDYYYLFLKGNVNRIYISNPYNSKSGYYIFIYDQNKNIITYDRTSTRSISLPSGAYWFRFSTPDPTTEISINSTDCLTTADDTNNYLKDNSDPNIENNEITSVFSNVGYSDPLNYLLQLPTMLINKLVSLSDTCESINFGTLLGSPIIFPCINLENIVGSSVWNTIDVICTVGLLVVIFKNLYQTFSNLMTMGGEKEAREKFNMPTPMEFLSYILGGDR